MRRLLLITTSLLVLAIPAGAQAEPLPPGFAGVLVDGPALSGQVGFAGQVAEMQRNNVSWVRLPVSWAEVEPLPGQFNFAKLDSMIAAAALRDIEVMPVVLHAPYWAAKPPAAINSHPARPSQYGNFMRTLASRYGHSGVFWKTPGVSYKPVRRWQVWNEPDMQYAWQRSGTSGWAPDYVALLKAARTGLMQADPRAQVVLAGLTNLAERSIRLVYRAGGGKYFDVAALHPFSAKPEGVIRTSLRLRDEMRARGDARKPLILSEVSWSSGGGKAIIKSSGRLAVWDTTESGQARRVSQLIRALVRNRAKLRLQSFAWATWLSPEPGSPYWFHYTGLNKLQSGQVVAKPALRAFRESLASPGG